MFIFVYAKTASADTAVNAAVGTSYDVGSQDQLTVDRSTIHPVCPDGFNTITYTGNENGELNGLTWHNYQDFWGLSGTPTATGQITQNYTCQHNYAGATSDTQNLVITIIDPAQQQPPTSDQTATTNQSDQPSTAGQCKTLFSTGNYFDSYEQIEYLGGFLVMHFKLLPLYSNGSSFLEKFYLHGSDCATTFSDEKLISNFRSGLVAWSVRFTSPSHYQIWDDEQSTQIQCDNCEGDLPAGNYGSITFSASQSNNIVLFHSSSYPINQPQGTDNGTGQQSQQQRVPVIIIPGLLGSEVNYNGDTIWPNVVKLVTDVSTSFLDPLSLARGFNPLITIGNVIQSINYVFGTYHYTDLLTSRLQQAGYTQGKDMFEFAYDWRMSVVQLAAQLSQKIEQIKTISGSNKVDVVAHSYGGLILKYYIQNVSGTDQTLDKIIFVGTPNLGAPQAAKTLIFGDNLGIPLVNSDEIQKISQNLYSIYQLLPSQEYFRHNPGFYDDLTNAGSKAALDFQQSYQLLLGLGKDKNLLDDANMLHSQVLDSLDLTQKPYKSFDLVGCGEFTLGTITKYYSGGSALKNLFTPKYRISGLTGDGTVPASSAAFLNVLRQNIFYTNDSDHGHMLSSDNNRELILQLLLNGQSSGTLPHITQDQSNCGIKGQLVSFPSNVDFSIRDSNGNNLVPGTNGVVLNKLGPVQSVFLPQDSSQSYKLDVQKPATGDNIDIDARDYINNKTTYYTNVTIKQHVELALDPSQPQDQLLNFDSSNNAVQVPASQEVAGAESLPPDINYDTSATDTSQPVQQPAPTVIYYPPQYSQTTSDNAQQSAASQQTVNSAAENDLQGGDLGQNDYQQADDVTNGQLDISGDNSADNSDATSQIILPQEYGFGQPINIHISFASTPWQQAPPVPSATSAPEQQPQEYKWQASGVDYSAAIIKFLRLMYHLMIF
ncbi:hypothetical protein KGQ24_00840 [Patescibacteria group bacterium]|nr:hypothetical protein [Patescibacteria group bacterium]